MADKNETTEYVVDDKKKASKAEKAKRLDLTNFNTLAIVSIATAASGFGAVAGVITGHAALNQIKRTEERGRGLAIAGVVIGYAYVGFAIVSALVGAALRLRGIELGGRFGDSDHMGQFGQQFGQQGQMGQFGTDGQGHMGGQFGGPAQGGMRGDIDGDGFGPGMNGQQGQGNIQPLPAPTATPGA